VREDQPRRRSPRLALAGALTATMLVAVGVMGGFGYAATAAKEAVDGVQSLLAANDPSDSIQVGGLSAGGDQYQPGFAWGDVSHTHTGPPGLTRPGGEFAPPLQVLCRGGVAVSRVRLVLDEQADLAVTVLGPGGKLLPLATGADAESTDTLTYRILVPRAFRLTLRMPCDLLQSGRSYRVRITATDPAGQASTLVIPFRPFAATD
jgi:hypothetical protein